MLLLILLNITAMSQSKFQLLLAGGPTFTPDIKYENATGHINTAMTGSLGISYRPIDAIGIELKYSGLYHPRSYLNNETDNRVKIYTSSRIVMQNIMGGFNYYLPLRRIQPFLGVLAGATYVQTTETAPESSIINFTWGLQAGAAMKLTKLLTLRLDASRLIIPNISNNSSYFGIAADGSGFPSFVIEKPSRADIKHYSINLGLLFNFGTRKK